MTPPDSYEARARATDLAVWDITSQPPVRMFTRSPIACWMAAHPGETLATAALIPDHLGWVVNGRQFVAIPQGQTPDADAKPILPPPATGPEHSLDRLYKWAKEHDAYVHWKVTVELPDREAESRWHEFAGEAAEDLLRRLDDDGGGAS